MNLSKQLAFILYLWYIFLMVSMICSFRAISSISVGLIIITSFFKNKFESGSWINNQLKNHLLASCCLFYLIIIISLLYTGNYNNSIKHLQTQSAIVFVPLAICNSGYFSKLVLARLMKFYVWILVCVLFYCLLAAVYRFYYLNAGDAAFFYYELVSPFHQHAIFVSIYAFIAFLYLLDSAKNKLLFYNHHVHCFLIFFLTCCILLLSSKLVICFSMFCLLYYAFVFIRVRIKDRRVVYTFLFSPLLLFLAILLTQNKISERFSEIVSGRLSIIEQKSFTPAIYFNGLQFRLLQWRFVAEILTEHHAWISGVADSAQILLDKKYGSTHMYIGDANTGRSGYLGYNTHNQFLQSLLQSGIPGLIAFILVCCSLTELAVKKKNQLFTIVVVLLIAYCFNEAVFETQYGIMLFTFFPLVLRSV